MARKRKRATPHKIIQHTRNMTMPTIEELLKSMESLVKTLQSNTSTAVDPIQQSFKDGQLNTANYVINFIKNY